MYYYYLLAELLIYLATDDFANFRQMVLRHVQRLIVVQTLL